MKGSVREHGSGARSGFDPYHSLATQQYPEKDLTAKTDSSSPTV
jgi:hypothetical protein